ncbi:MAG: hypothetical protein GY792_16085 [Gammaproteobacteria bacterium]|nr:hypothetical protein [Gammaproteobacteria bacterium]
MALLIGGISLPATAALELVVDPSTQEFYLTGSDAGDPEDVYSFGTDAVSWGLNSLGGLGGSSIWFDGLGVMTSSPDVFSNANYGLTVNNSFSNITVTVFWSDLVSTQAITGTEVWVDYSGMSSENILFFEEQAALGTVLPYSFEGSPFADITMSVVPEPSSALLSATSLLVLGVIAQGRRGH